MGEDIDYALVQFILCRKEGDMLRDIAIRTLEDRQRKNETRYIPSIKLRTQASETTPAKSLFRRGKCVRILPSILYAKLKPCGHNYKKICHLI